VQSFRSATSVRKTASPAASISGAGPRDRRCAAAWRSGGRLRAPAGARDRRSRGRPESASLPSPAARHSRMPAKPARVNPPNRIQARQPPQPPNAVDSTPKMHASQIDQETDLIRRHRRAIASPMPLVPPVTSTAFAEKSNTPRLHPCAFWVHRIMDPTGRTAERGSCEMGENRTGRGFPYRGALNDAPSTARGNGDARSRFTSEDSRI
jgi:hypothetical protein